LKNGKPQMQTRLLLSALLLAGPAVAFPAQPKTVDICELLRTPEIYQGMLVKVRGAMVANGATGCPSNDSVTIDTDHRYTIWLGAPNASPKAVNMTVVGTFHWTPGDPVLEAKSFSDLTGPSQQKSN
jgi:hypothetical protein